MREILPADTAGMKRHIMDYQGLFLKQYGAQRLSLLPQGEFIFISCFYTKMLCALQVSSEC